MLAGGVEALPMLVISGWRGAAAVVALSFAVIAGAGVFVFDGQPGSNASAWNIDGLAGLKSQAAGAGDVDERIAALAERLKQSPDDIEGWRMLGWSYFSVQRYQESAEAYARAVALDPADTDMRSAQAEAVVQAAGGRVTLEALREFESVLKLNPPEHRSRFYVALAREQAGELSLALDQWQDLLKDAPTDAGWRVGVTSHIDDLHVRTGRGTASAPIGSQVGATESQVIQALPEADKQAMIRGMVDGLTERLATSPHDAEGWLKLIRSRMVMNEPALARAALRAAMAEFSADPASRERFTALALDLGLTVD